MEMCRACLSTEKGMVPLDEVFVNNYNLLTNLNITLNDGMPHVICGNCLDTVNFFIDFRAKSISSETTLREIICPNVKSEEYFTLNEDKVLCLNTNYSVDIKQEIKDEDKDIESILDNGYEQFEDYEDIDYIVENDGDVKLKKSKTKSKQSKRLKKKAVKLKIPKIIKEELIDSDKLYCGVCTKTFEDKSELDLHLENHKKDKYCGQCSEQFNGWSQLLGHRLIHIPTKQRHCHICLKRFMSCVYLEHHYRNTHIEGEGTKLTCKLCQSTYDTPRKLKKHTWSIHGDKKYVCDHCSKRFKSKSLLSIHVAMHTGKKAYVCDQCGFRSKFSGGLKDHKIRRHTVGKVYCKKCHRPFKSQEDHDKHKCSNKVVMCPICGVQFNRTMKLSRHMESHSDVSKYECNRCPAKFKTRSALKAHLDRHDGNKTKQCEFCPAKFYTGSTLIKHRRVHTGEKPYVCKVCNKGFTGNNNLKVHMRVHGEYLINKKNKEPEVTNSFTDIKIL